MQQSTQETSQNIPRYRHFWAAFSTILIAGVILGLVSGLQACDNTQPPPTTIEIASDFPTSGLEATSGQPMQNAVQMAIDDANHNQVLPGYTFKLTPYDDVGSGGRHNALLGASNIKKAIADNLVAGVIGPKNSSVALTEMPLANNAPIALLSPTTSNPCLTKSDKVDPACTGSYNLQPQVRPTGQLTFFRLATTDDHQGKAAADYLFQTKHYQKVLLLQDDSDSYSFGLASSFQNEWTNLGGQVIPLALPEQASGPQDYQKILQTVAPLQPDLIYFAGNDPNDLYALQALSNIPALKTVAFAGGDGIVNNAFLQVTLGLHPVAPIYASVPNQDPDYSGTSVGKNFKKMYLADGYTDYQPFVGSAYDCTMMLIQAIKTALQTVSTPHGAQDSSGAASFRQAILHALSKLSYMGATGNHSFDPNGDTTNHTISLYQLNLSATTPDWTWLQQVSG